MTVLNNKWLGLLLLFVAYETTHSAAWAETPASSSSGIVDIVLSPDNRAHGWLLENDGHPIEGAIVVLSQRGSESTRTVTDQEGRYEFIGIKPGIYQLQVGDQLGVIRVWDQATAPPAARSSLTVVRNSPVIRGQSGNPAAFSSSPRGLVGIGMIGIALGTITLVGIEATANDDSDSSSFNNMPPSSTRTVSP